MGGCKERIPSVAPEPIPALSSLSNARAVSAEALAVEGAIRFLEERIRKDPEDFIALNKLAGYYHQRLRETGDFHWLAQMKRTAEASIKAIPADQNPVSLSLLAQVEFAQHNFGLAGEYAWRLIGLDGGKAYPYQILGDVLLEVGDYQGAEKAFRELEKREPGTYLAETRRGRMALLHGDLQEALKRYTNALLRALEMVPTQRETIAWTWWQLGELAFSTGDYSTAERHCRDALAIYPDYYRALAGLGRALGAQGDLQGAIVNYEQAVKRLPDPAVMAALGDVYQLVGREQQAARQFALCENVAAMGASDGRLYDRQMAVFYADHDRKPEEAYQIAKREYEVRRDIYGADALAWTALKSGRIEEAKLRIEEVLRLRTQDAGLFYHAGMIARAAGDTAASRQYLQRALALSPRFDLRQAPIARSAFDCFSEKERGRTSVGCVLRLPWK